MRKLSVLLIACVLMMLTAFPSAAISAQDLGALAAYVPEDAVAYGAIRTDDAVFEELDAVLQSVISQLPEGMLPPITVDALLDEIGGNTAGGDDWESTFGVWLGESAAIYYSDAEALIEGEVVTFVFSVRDADAALTFVESTLFGTVITEAYNDGTLVYEEGASAFSSFFFVNDDVLIAAVADWDFDFATEGADWFITQGATLADNADFQTALDRLPLSDYNGVGYLNLEQFVPFADEIQEELAFEGIPIGNIDLAAALTALGAQSAGITILDGRSLTLDIASNVADADLLASAGVPLEGGTAINLDFTSRFAPDTVAILQDTGLGTNILEGLAAIKAIGDYYDAEAEVRFLEWDEEGLQFIDDVITFVELSLQGMSGQSLEESLSWMTGDYAVALSSTQGNVFPILPNFGVVVDSPNADDAAAYTESANNLFYELGFRIGDSDGGFALTAFSEAFSDPNLALQFSGADGVLTVGTPLFTTDMRDGGASITDTPTFEAAQSTFVDDIQFLAYINAAPLVPVAETLSMFAPELQELLPFLPVLDSANVTASYDETGSGVVRLVITVSE